MKPSSRLAGRALAVLAALALPLGAPEAARKPGGGGATAPSYSITDLGTLPGDTASAAYAMNERGQVAGQSTYVDAYGYRYDSAFLLTPKDTNGDGIPDLWHEQDSTSASGNKLIQDLGTLGGASSAALGISETGHVVGWSETVPATGDPLYTEDHAFLYSNGLMSDLGTLGGAYSYAYGVSDSGGILEVVGYSATSYTAGDNRDRAFRWNATGGMQEMGTLALSADGLSYLGYSFATAINGTGQVVGAATAADARQHAFRTAKSQLDPSTDDLGQSGVTSRAFGVNSHGHVVGESANSQGQTHAFLWKDGTATDLGALSGGSRSSANAIDNNGRIVGWSNTSTSSTHRAFVYIPGTGMVDLRSRLDRTAQNSWDLREATDISDDGKIVGWGYYNGKQRAFLLIPR